MLTTSDLIYFVRRDNAVLADAHATEARKNAAVFRLDKNLVELERRAVLQSDEAADEFLYEELGGNE